MKTASRILGTAFFLQGYEVQDAPRYGAERRGAPIFAYVRAAKKPLYERGVIPHPDLLVVADDSLIGVAAAGVIDGILPHTVVLLNSETAASVWQHRLNISCPIITLPMPLPVLESGYHPAIGAACTGAAARLLGVIARESLRQAVEQELQELGAEVIAQNVHQTLAAYDAQAEHTGLVQASPLIGPVQGGDPGWVQLPFEDAGRSAPAIHAAATSVQVRTGLWRVLRPQIDLQRCNRCWWVCSESCPDGAIEVVGDTPVIDYQHCKGCMICVTQCPPHAIHAIAEREAQQAELEG